MPQVYLHLHVHMRNPKSERDYRRSQSNQVLAITHMEVEILCVSWNKATKTGKAEQWP